MGKSITRIVLTGGPAAGKTTLISRIIKEFDRGKGWRVITIPETATDLISGFGIKPFDGCVSMEDFQYFVISDQLHKEKLALKAAELVPEDKILIIYDRALFDQRAYVNDEEFAKVLSYFGVSADAAMAGYDAVLHLVTCAKGAEDAYNFGNAARYEDVATAREKDDLSLRAWSAHPKRYIIDNSADFEDKINRAVNAVYSVIGESAPETGKRKFLIEKPDCTMLAEKYNAVSLEMMQTYLYSKNPKLEKRVRQQKDGSGFRYFYTEKRIAYDGKRWVTEKPIGMREYVSYLMDSDMALHQVRKVKYSFATGHNKIDIDVYPFSHDRAILFIYGANIDVKDIPSDFHIIKDVTDDPDYKNRRLAESQSL